VTDQDRLAEIKARRITVPDPPYEVEDTVSEEEFYMRWRLIHYGPTDEYGWRDWWAGIPGGDADAAEFIAHAPEDIDWLVAKVDRLQGLLGRLEWAGTVVFDEWYDKGKCCPVCKGEPEEGHAPGCELAEVLGQTQKGVPPSS
jgi:hypothetical protein